MWVSFLKFVLGGLLRGDDVQLAYDPSTSDKAEGRGSMRDRQRTGDRDRKGGRRGRKSCAATVGVGALQLPWLCAVSLCLRQELLPARAPQE